jgi:DNA replication protein
MEESMSKYYIFLKNNIIDFEKLLIDKYSFLGLDEVEVIILLKLNKLINSGSKFSIEYFTKNMTITEDVIREKLVTLINNGFIDLKLVNRSEIYCLDDTFKRLSSLLEKEELEEEKEDLNTDCAKVAALLEKEFKKILSPLELELVHKWVYEDKFDYSKIYNAIMETLKYKKTSVQYVDVILNKKEQINKQSNSKEGLQDLFNQVYGQIK